MIDTDKYFVYPLVGVTTNPGVSGENHSSIRSMYRSELLLHIPNYPVYHSLEQLSRFDASFVMQGETPAERYHNFSTRQNNYTRFFDKYPFRTWFYIKMVLLALANDVYIAISKLSRVIKS
jgi:lantibiotic modifying enzyme